MKGREIDVSGGSKFKVTSIKKLNGSTLVQMLEVFHFLDLALQMATQNGSGSVSILLE